METNESVVNEQEVQSTGSDEAPAITPPSESENSGAESVAEKVATGQGTINEEGEYVPNYKFNAYEKEYEIEEWARPFVTNKELEDKFRKLHQMAYGFEGTKENLNKWRENYHKLDTDYKGLNGGLESLRGYIKQGDFDNFFKATNIPLDKVWGWVKDKIKYNDLSPEDKRRYDEEVGLKRNHFESEKTNSKLTEELNNAKAGMLEREMDYEMNKPEVAQLVKAYDAKFGTGAFRFKAAQVGMVHQNLHGETLPGDKAVQEFLKDIQFGGLTANKPQTQQNDPNTTVIVQNGNTKPVIPNIKGRSTSPVKKGYKSIEEMRSDFKRQLNDRAARN